MTDEEIRAEVARRRRRLTLALLGIGAAACTLAFAVLGLVKLTQLRWLGLLTFFGWGILVFWGNRYIDTFWICPACGQPLQKSQDFRETCPRCGVKLW